MNRLGRGPMVKEVAARARPKARPAVMTTKKIRAVAAGSRVTVASSMSRLCAFGRRMFAIRGNEESGEQKLSRSVDAHRRSVSTLVTKRIDFRWVSANWLKIAALRFAGLRPIASAIFGPSSNVKAIVRLLANELKPTFMSRINYGESDEVTFHEMSVADVRSRSNPLESEAMDSDADKIIDLYDRHARDYVADRRIGLERKCVAR